MIGNRSRDIKRAQKEAALLREVSKLFMQLSMDEPLLRDLFINRIHLSPDKSHCTVYFYTAAGKAAFEEKLPLLILYKPSMRHALSQELIARYTPDLRFAFDEQFEKQQHIEHLLDSIKSEPEKGASKKTEKK
jgi:ribosome-binding factor A